MTLPIKGGKVLSPIAGEGEGYFCAHSIMLLNRILKILFRTIKIFFVLILGFLCFYAGVFALHAGLSVCPYHMRRFQQPELIPVVYGYPAHELLLKASRGEIVLGGCIVDHIRAVCPYCRWPARSALFNRESANTW